MKGLAEVGGGRYVLQRELGAGGMGVVYEAFDQERQVAVALKTIKNVSPESIARFKHEFRAIADLAHPNIATLYEMVSEDGEIFFTMELVEGVSFLQWVRRPLAEPASKIGALIAERERPKRGDDDSTAYERPPPVDTELTRSLPVVSTQTDSVINLRRLRTSMRQLGEAVVAIHDAGMLHRDLKPSNVMVADDGRVVVLDFGLVTDIEAERHEPESDRALEGTAAFMSPEQGARVALSPASDWYSVGVMLYSALTGRTPFVGGQHDVLMDKQQFEPPAPREIVPGVPTDLNALCVEMLRRNPDRRPTGAEVLRRLGSTVTPERTNTQTRQSTYVSALVGRDNELDALSSAFRTTLDGVPVLMCVSGTSGMGKSHLTRVFLDRLRSEHRALVLTGRCYEHESVPFKALDSLVDSLSTHLATLPDLEVEGLMPRDAIALARVFPVMRQVEAVTAGRRRTVVAPDPQELRRRAFSALRELVTRIADRDPLVLAIDDGQWGDADSAALLINLLRDPDPPAITVIVSYRGEDVPSSPFLTALLDPSALPELEKREVSVGPLNPEDAISLAKYHLSEAGISLANSDRIARESGGNPFFVGELARHVRDASDDSSETISLNDVLRHRFRRLPEAARRLLATVAVAGRPLPVSIASRAADARDPATLSLLKAGNFLRTRLLLGERCVETFHDRVREATYAHLSEDERRERHLRLAHMFEAMPHSDPEALALHFMGAGLGEQAATHADRAGDRAVAALAFDRAAEHYRFALDADRSTGAKRLSRRSSLGNALANAGRGAEAAEAYLSAVEDANAAQTLDLQRRASAQLLYSGHISEGLATIGNVLEGVGMRLAPTPARALWSLLINRARLGIRGLKFKRRDESEIPPSELARVDITMSVAQGLAMVDPIRAAEFQTRNLILALETGEPKRVARALVFEAVFTSLPGASASKKSAKILDVIEGIRVELSDPLLDAVVHGAIGIVALQEGRFEGSYEACQRAEEVFRDLGTAISWELATAHIFQVFALYIMGKLKTILRRYPLLVREAQERGDLYAATSLRVSMAFWMWIARDDPEGGYAEIDDAMKTWSPDGYHLQHSHALGSRVNLDIYAGEATRAWQRCLDDWKPLTRSLLLRAQVMRAFCHQYRGRAAVGAAADGTPGALRDAVKMARKLRKEKVAYCTALATLIEAGIANVRGDTERAIERLTLASTELDESGMALYAVVARRQHGLCLGGTEGDAMRRKAESFCARKGFKNPDKFCEVLAPGFASS